VVTYYMDSCCHIHESSTYQAVLFIRSSAGLSGEKYEVTKTVSHVRRYILRTLSRREWRNVRRPCSSRWSEGQSFDLVRSMRLVAEENTLRVKA
jgi:hypothetical protein